GVGEAQAEGPQELVPQRMFVGAGPAGQVYVTAGPHVVDQDTGVHAVSAQEHGVVLLERLQGWGRLEDADRPSMARTLDRALQALARQPEARGIHEEVAGATAREPERQVLDETRRVGRGTETGVAQRPLVVAHEDLSRPGRPPPGHREGPASRRGRGPSDEYERSEQQSQHRDHDGPHSNWCDDPAEPAARFVPGGGRD